MIPLDFGAITTQRIHAQWLEAAAVELSVLRIDKLHPVVSGNKWFKLKYYLQEAKQQMANTIATFGGPWSNHIAATAYACKAEGIRCVGIIRGERPRQLSATLGEAESNHMELIFTSRESYSNKTCFSETYPDWYFIPEGGYGALGVAGAAEILQMADQPDSYSHIIAGVGSGTMLAGITRSAGAHQHVVGISSMKNNYSLHEEICSLLPEYQSSFEIVHDYHFGGFGKHSPALIQFMNEVYRQHQLPLDFVYTAKVFYATRQMVVAKRFEPGSKLLMIHSGGLQGNRSLLPQVLAF